MAVVACLLPRHWDGRRLLQFLTGLALIALAFAAPALWSAPAQPAEPAVTVITTVDSPGHPVYNPPASEAPAAGEGVPPGPATVDRAGGNLLDAPRGVSPAGLVTGSQTVGGDAAAPAPAHHSWTVDGLPGDAGLVGYVVCAEGRAAGTRTAQGAHGERAPPLI